MEPPACPSKQLPCACTKTKLEAAIKPKTEPCGEDSPLLPLPAPDAAADDWEVTSLSGDHPFFTTVMSRSQVQKPFQLVIPTRFLRHLPEARAPGVLLYGGRSWTVTYCGDLKCKKLGSEWRDFAVDNRLRIGDACVFELMATQAEGETKNSQEMGLVFRVQVLRGDLPEEITSRGATSDEPMVIVD
uniref:TF-B3 domain-containing protein n=1 Tax=Arundo donax TaxID=35708 RepID=A0A0A9CYZ3_ARUDO